MGATTVTASCHHHQAIDKVGDGLRVVARAADGIVEALELDPGSGCSRCSGTPRTRPRPTPRSSTSSTPSSPSANLTELA